MFLYWAASSRFLAVYVFFFYILKLLFCVLISFCVSLQHWLATDEEDGLLERVLTPAVDGAVEYSKKVPFEVVVYTSDISNAGTDANIFMDVYGRLPDGTECSDGVKFDKAMKSSFEVFCFIYFYFLFYFFVVVHKPVFFYLNLARLGGSF